MLTTQQPLRSQRMQKINPQALINAGNGLSSVFVSNSALEDIVDYKKITSKENYLLAHDDGGPGIPNFATVSGSNFDFEEQYFSALPSLYSHSKKRVPGTAALMDAMNSRKGKVKMVAPGIILALPDGAGMAREMNNWMQFAQGYAESLYQEPPIDWARESTENIQHAEAYLTAMEVWKLKNKFLDDTTKERLDGEWDLNGDKVQRKLELQAYLRKVEAEGILDKQVIYGDLLFELKEIYDINYQKYNFNSSLYDAIKLKYYAQPTLTNTLYQSDLETRVKSSIAKHRSNLVGSSVDSYKGMVEKLQVVVKNHTDKRNGILAEILESSFFLPILKDYEKTDINKITIEAGSNVDKLFSFLSKDDKEFDDFLEQLKSPKIKELIGFSSLLSDVLASLDCAEKGRELLVSWADEMSTENENNLLFIFFTNNDVKCKEEVDFFISNIKSVPVFTNEQIDKAYHPDFLTGDNFDYVVGLYKQLTVANKVLIDRLITDPLSSNKRDKAFLSLTNALTLSENTQHFANTRAQIMLIDLVGAISGEALHENEHAEFIKATVASEYDTKLKDATHLVHDAEVKLKGVINGRKFEYEQAAKELKSAKDNLHKLLTLRSLPARYYTWLLEGKTFFANLFQSIEQTLRPMKWSELKYIFDMRESARQARDVALERFINYQHSEEYIQYKTALDKAQNSLDSINNEINHTIDARTPQPKHIKGAAGLALIVVVLSCVEMYRMGKKWQGNADDYVKLISLNFIVIGSIADIALSRVPEALLKESNNKMLGRLGRLSALGLFFAGFIDVCINFPLFFKSIRLGRLVDTIFYGYKSLLGLAWGVKGTADYLARGGLNFTFKILALDGIGINTGNKVLGILGRPKIAWVLTWEFLLISVFIEVLYVSFIKDTPVEEWFEQSYFGEDGMLAYKNASSIGQFMRWDRFNSKEDESSALNKIFYPE